MKAKMKKSSNITVAGIGLLISICMIVVCAAIVSLLIHTGTIEEGNTGHAAMIALLISTAVGNIVSVKMDTLQKWLASLLQASALFAVMLFCSMFMFEGPTDGVVATALVIFGVAMAAFLLFGKEKRSKIKKGGRYRF